jgi:hypothetical protein
MVEVGPLPFRWLPVSLHSAEEWVEVIYTRDNWALKNFICFFLQSLNWERSWECVLGTVLGGDGRGVDRVDDVVDMGGWVSWHLTEYFQDREGGNEDRDDSKGRKEGGGGSKERGEQLLPKVALKESKEM